MKEQGKEDQNEDEKIAINMRWDFKNQTKIKKFGICNLNNGCGNRYRRMLTKAERSIAKELDLLKFLHRQRTTAYAALSSLTAR